MIPIKPLPSTNQQRGFALLMTLLIISVVLSVALTTLSLSIKQTRLATDTRDAEIAFHAANAGLECLRYWRRAAASNFEDNTDQEIACFGTSDVRPEEGNVVTQTDGDGDIYQYQYSISWGTGTSERCSEMRFLVFNADSSSVEDLELANMDDHIPGYSINNASNVKACEPGGLCTVFSSRGYSAGCHAREHTGTIQRDILLEF